MASNDYYSAIDDEGKALETYTKLCREKLGQMKRKSVVLAQQTCRNRLANTKLCTEKAVDTSDGRKKARKLEIAYLHRYTGMYYVQILEEACKKAQHDVESLRKQKGELQIEHERLMLEKCQHENRRLRQKLQEMYHQVINHGTVENLDDFELDDIMSGCSTSATTTTTTTSATNSGTGDAELHGAGANVEYASSDEQKWTPVENDVASAEMLFALLGGDEYVQPGPDVVDDAPDNGCNKQSDGFFPTFEAIHDYPEFIYPAGFSFTLSGSIA